MARIGKIARLPGGIRSQLNSRLHNGDVGRQIVPWLNSLPEVKRVLAQQFEGRPITEQNLSDWRLGGYEEWLGQREVLALANELAANQRDQETVTRGASLTGLVPSNQAQSSPIIPTPASHPNGEPSCPIVPNRA
jgi:hypothetical protein